MANILSDILKGAGTGATVGTVVPGIGTAIGAGAGALFGAGSAIMEMIKAGNAKKEANQNMPALYDPMQLAMLDEIQHKRKSLLTGSAYAGGVGAIDQSQAATNRAIVSASGGDVGSSIQGLLQSQSVAGRSKNQLYGQAAQQDQFYTTLGTDFLNRVSDRALQLQLYDVQQNRAEWAQYAQDAYANAANAVSRFDSSALLDIFSGMQNANRGNQFPSYDITAPQTSQQYESPIPELGGGQEFSAISELVG